MLGLLQPFIASMVRHALTTVAGALVTQGLLKADQVNSFVGACLLFGTIGWSLWQKINTPENLAKLTARASQKTLEAKKAWTGVVLQSSPNMIAGLILAGLLAAAPAPAKAQGLSLFSSAPVAKVKAKKPLPKRMNAGLASLIPGLGGGSLLDGLFAKIQAASIEDLQYAKALADAIPDSPAAQARSRCWAAWISFIAQQSGAQATQEGKALGATPAAHIFTRFEQMSQAAEQLKPMSNLNIACAPVAQAMKLQFGQFVLQVLGGAVSLGTLGVMP